jgi:predicted ATPase
LALSCDFRVGVSDRAERQLRGLFALAPNEHRPGSQVIVGSRSLRRISGPLCGRHAELRALARNFMRAEQGGAVALRVEGPAGIGKTRLALEFGHRLRRVLKDQQPRTLIAACASRGRGSDYSAFMTLLGRLLDAREGEPPEQAWKLEANLQALGLSYADTSRLVKTICDCRAPQNAHQKAELVGLATRRLQTLAKFAPHVVALDNAQEVDEKSVELFQRLIDKLQGTKGILLLFLARPSDDLPLRGLTPECLQLGPLSVTELSRLVSTRFALRKPPEALMTFIDTHAEGNPLFVEELLRLATDQRALSFDENTEAHFEPKVSLAASRFLRSVVAGRVGALPKAQRAVLLAVARAGRSAPVSEIRRLSQLSETAFDQSFHSLEERHMLIRDEQEVRVTPPLVSEVLLADLEGQRLRNSV